ncbi:bacteriocin class II family protein [Marinifilum fragile]|uniref:bacteriocin class II family protein n=1 Tax=Marinifilum fragile TaxID=570161 RepID=UPI002AA884C8|nr:bacteriocin class II family protein [Marinifilum fragile]
MKNFEVMNKLELSAIKGGRTVDKVDLDDDGKWDIKIVTRNDGTIVTKTRR